MKEYINKIKDLFSGIIKVPLFFVGLLYKFYFYMEKYKKLLLLLLFIAAFIGGYYIYSSLYGLNWNASFYYSLTQFIGEVKLPAELGLNDVNTTISSIQDFTTINKHYDYIYISAFLALLTSFLTVLLLFFKDSIKTLYIKHVSKYDDYTLVIGLGENNRAYVKSEIENKKKKIIVIEENKDHSHISYFESKGVGCLLGTVEDYKDFINNGFPKDIVISVGNDRKNIDIASTLDSLYYEDKGKRPKELTIYIHLDNHKYEAMYRQKLLDDKLKRKENANLNIMYRPYSFYDDAARSLWMKHTVLGNFSYVIDSEKRETYSIILVGTGRLAERIIYHMYMLSQLPNNDIFNITCIDKEASSFVKRVNTDFFYTDKITNVNLCASNLTTESKQFYASDIWKEKNLTNVILCSDDENINLENAITLYDRVFLSKINDEDYDFKTKILFAMYHNYELGHNINNDQNKFRNFYTFGTIEDICSTEHLVRETHENLAKLIHNGYGDKYDVEHKKFFDYIDQENKIHENIQNKWIETAKYFDRESNRSQALHIDSKLLSLGLRTVKINKKEINEQLLKNNVELFNQYSDKESLAVNDQRILYISKQLHSFYMGCEFDNDAIEDFYQKLMADKSKISKLMKSEHSRWNTHHYLNGWQYHKEKKKEIKLHNCLTKLENFTDIDRKITIIYDLYSVLYIPSYLASVGQKIVPIEYDDNFTTTIEELPVSKLNVGVTGHRNISTADKRLKVVLKEGLEQYLQKYDEVELFSPLAEGADRLFVDTLVEMVPEKIKAIKVFMPFTKEIYMKDFKEKESKEDFLNYLNPNYYKNIYDIKIEDIEFCDNSISKNEAYERVGQCIVDKCDFLIAIWDGQEADGVGGTGDIVAYAQSEKKPILYINTETLMVERLNFEGIL